MTNGYTWLLVLSNLSLAAIFELVVTKTYWMLPRCETTMWLIVSAIVSFGIADLLAYGFHRFLHQQKQMYHYIHSIHHQERRPHLVSTVIMHPVELVSFFFLYRLPILTGILPFNTTTFLVYQTVLIVWVSLDHSYNHSIFSDHFAHHKWSHGNYATCLPLWDHWFGTCIVNHSEY